VDVRRGEEEGGGERLRKVRARTVKPPSPIDVAGAPSVFLAGSIEMGEAGRWQDGVAAALSDLEVTILNPRRDDWDASWRQSIEDPRFRGQVEWELDALEAATLVAMHFDPATKSPITLLELGLTARTGKILVSCPSGFWKRGNVEAVCARHGVPLVDGVDGLVAAVRARIAEGGR
jgi:hypothetical protein